MKGFNLTVPLAKDSTNVLVQRVDLGEAQPIDDAVELVGRRVAAGQFRAPDVAAAWQWVSGLMYAPLAPHLTNVSHLIVCPDAQLARRRTARGSLARGSVVFVARHEGERFFQSLLVGDLHAHRPVAVNGGEFVGRVLGLWPEKHPSQLCQFALPRIEGAKLRGPDD